MVITFMNVKIQQTLSFLLNKDYHVLASFIRGTLKVVRVYL